MSAFISQLDQAWPKWRAWVAITRLDKPVGIYLLLWPTLWALFLAAEGLPSLANILIFTFGVILMRSAGCVINDFADRKIDGGVERTKDRPLATGALSSKEALLGFAVICLVALLLVLLTNSLTIMLSVGGVFLAALYPFMKRYTHMPQVFLGAAFSWSIPMAFAAEADALPPELWLIYIANLCWTVAYDTYYAMVDRDDDVKLGVKSTAILFAEFDLHMIGMLKLISIMCLYLVGQRFELAGWFNLSLILALVLSAWQLWSARSRSREVCFAMFKQSHWFGVIVLAGMILSLVP